MRQQASPVHLQVDRNHTVECRFLVVEIRDSRARPEIAGRVTRYTSRKKLDTRVTPHLRVKK